MDLHTVLAVVLVVIAFGVVSALGNLDLTRVWREPLLKQQERGWVRRGRMPKVVRRTYWTDAEFRRDRARLEALGFLLADEAAIEDDRPEINLHGRTIPQRPLPVLYAVFERRD
jgi:hypothetical protein